MPIKCRLAPYICYNPKDRILLSPFEDSVKKLHSATQAGGGLRSKYIRRHFGDIVRLFEEIVLGKEMLPITTDRDKASQVLAYRRKQIDDELLEDDARFSSAGNVRNS